MKTILNLLATTLILSSCSVTSSISENTSSSISSSEIQHEYSEINDRKVLWNDIFFSETSTYYVYFYSLTCSHCAQLKNKIIAYALNHNDIYFCADSQDVIIRENVKSTIGISSSDKLAIKGFPSLIKISSGKLVSNVAGVDNISLLLGI